jgi:hypothetical protein
VIIVRGKVDSLISDQLQFALNYATKWCRRTKLNINPRTGSRWDSQIKSVKGRAIKALMACRAVVGQMMGPETGETYGNLRFIMVATH